MAVNVLGYLGVGEEEEHEHNRIPEEKLGLAQHERVHFQSPLNVIIYK